MEPDVDVHQKHLYEGEPDEDLISALEPDQLVRATEEPLPPFRFGRKATVGLWTLRVFVLVVAALVIYVFAADLARGARTAVRPHRVERLAVADDRAGTRRPIPGVSLRWAR